MKCQLGIHDQDFPSTSTCAYPEEPSGDEKWQIQDPHGQRQIAYSKSFEGLFGVVGCFHGSTPSVQSGT